MICNSKITIVVARLQQWIYLFVVLIIAPLVAQSQPVSKPNILFIAVDDLKPDLNCFGFSAVKSPNFDNLASHSTIFTANYCQQAVCGPTRASLMTGVRPDRTKVWDLKTLIRDMNPDIVSMPQYFMQNGYVTAAMGKIYDPRSVDKKHDERSWTLPYKKKFVYAAGYDEPVAGLYQSPGMRKQFASLSKTKGADDDENLKDDIKVSTECIVVPDDAYSDGAMTNMAISDLKKLGKEGKPFFLAVGYRKPHLPFVAPKKYWDMYDRSTIKLATWQKPSINGPSLSYHSAGELRNYKDITPIDDSMLLHLSDDKQRELIHGYYACISYTDAQVGKLLAALKEEGLDKNTIVVIWGDHGWHLGDHSLWCKHSNFEQATRAPLIISLPGQTKPINYTSQTEYVDIFPTLVELAGLPKVNGLDGVSLMPALKGSTKPLKEYSISQWPKGGSNGGKEVMGYALRTPRYRYVEWVGKNFRSNTRLFNEADVVAAELYDYKTDPDETENVLDKKEYEGVKKELSAKLHEFFKQQQGKK